MYGCYVVKKGSKLKLSRPQRCFCYENMLPPSITHYLCCISPNDSGLQCEWLPVLFALYTLYHDLSQIPFSSQIPLYADNTKCTKIITSPDDQSVLQEDLNQICDWSHHSELSFNLSKSHIIHFSTNTTTPHNY